VNEEQKLAVAKILNLLMALAVNANMTDQSHKDIWDAAEAFGISKLDLLKAISNSPPELGPLRGPTI